MPRIQQKNKPENLQDREEKLKNLATFNKMALEAMTVAELRELGAFLVPNYRKLRKPEMIDALIEVSAHYRAEALKENLAAIELMGDIDLSPEFIIECKNKNLSSDQVSKIIIKTIESKGYAESTIAKTVPRQIKKVLDTVALKLSDGTTKNWTDEIFDFVREHVKDYHRKVNKETAIKVEAIGDVDSKDGVIYIDGKKVINWAIEKINWAYEQENLDKGWHSVSLALALTSGRRQDEIHGTCEYRAIDENTLEATGLSKKKDDHYKHKSPCLVNAQKWVEVINKLPVNLRDQPNSEVNQNIRKKIEKSIKDKELKFLGFTKYKDSRDFYVSYLISTEYHKSKHGSEINFAKKLLGHESKRQTLHYEKICVENV